MTDNLTVQNPAMDPQNGSTFARLPAEIHILIAMECESDEAVFALLGTCKMLSGIYRDLLYERNIRYDEGSAVLKIARNGEVAAFRHLKRIAATMDEGMPDLNRIQYRIEGGHGYMYTFNPFYHPSYQGPTYEFTALHWAAANGHSEAVQWLIDNNVDCNALGAANRNANGLSLYTMVRWDDEENPVLPTFLDAYDGQGAPLYYAVWYGHLETCRRLCAAGATAFGAAGSCLTELHLAVLRGHVDIIRDLVKTGVTTSRQNHRFIGSAIQWAALSTESTRSIQCLFELGEDIVSALDWLLAQKLPSQVNEVLDSINIDLRTPAVDDASTNQATAILASCIKYAARLSRTERHFLHELVKYLINSGADVNYSGRLIEGSCFLKRAFLEIDDNGFIAQLLLKSGAEVRGLRGNDGSAFVTYLKGFLDKTNHPDYKKRRDGLYVSQFKMDLLLEYGADPSLKSTLDGRAPFDYAKQLVCQRPIPPNLAILSRLRSY